MAGDAFTHSFKFQLGTDWNVEGQAEFNIDDEASWNYSTVTPQADPKQFEAILALFQDLKRVHQLFGEIRKIEVKKLP